MQVSVFNCHSIYISPAVPGIVSNATAVAVSPTSILIKWLEPSEKNGIITGMLDFFIAALSIPVVENVWLASQIWRFR